MKKFIALLLTVALTAGIAVSGTLAYLTQDVGEKNNVFTVGNINVSLDEETGVIGEGGSVTEKTDGAEYTEIMPGDYLKKEVTVSNDGKTPAYVAVTVTLNNATAINAAIDDVYGDGDKGGQAMYDLVFDGWGINQNPRPGEDGGVSNTGKDDARGVIDGTYGLPEYVLQVDFTKTLEDYWLYGVGNWFHGVDEKAGQYWVDSVSVDNFGGGYYAKNMESNEICYTYYLYLPAGASSTLFKGLNVPAEFNANQLAMFAGLEINVEAKAIQADNMGIADIYNGVENGEAKTAFAILAGDIDDSAAGTNNTPVTTEVSNLTALTDAINNAKAGDTIVLGADINATQLTVEKNITIDLNGKTITADNGYGIISLKNGASIKNGNIDVDSNVAAIRAFDVGSIENVTIHIDPKNTDKVATAIAVQNGGYVGTISNVTITGATQGIELGKGAKVDLIQGVNVNAVSNGTKEGVALQINAGNVGKVVNSTLSGEAYGVHMMLNGEYDVAATLENCNVTGGTAGIYAHDEVGIPNNNNCSLTLNYDTATTVTGGIVTEFEAEALPVVSINNVKATSASVANNEALAAAIAAGKTELTLADGTYTMPAVAKGKTLTINGTKDTVIEVVPAGQGEANGQLDYNLDGSTVTFNGVTIKTNSQTYAGYARLSGTYNNCVIQNTYNLGTGNSAFYNCVINITNEYLRVGGATSAIFDGCTFNTDGRAILVFQDGTSVAQNVTVKDCTFNATAAANTWNGIHVAAVSIDGTNGSYVVNLEGTNTVDSDFNGLWQIKAGEANVTVNVNE